MPDKHHRRSIRLGGYDYAQPGAYFVTVCTRDWACLFGHVVNGEMHLNEAGEIAQRCWQDIPHHFPHVELDTFIVMPNHIHGIIVITDTPTVGVSDIAIPCKGEKSFAPTDAATPRSPSRTIGSVVRGFKTGVTKWFRANTDIHFVWLRNYYEHVVRSERELNAIREYIVANPTRWDDDENNPTFGDPGTAQSVPG